MTTAAKPATQARTRREKSERDEAKRKQQSVRRPLQKLSRLSRARSPSTISRSAKRLLIWSRRSITVPRSARPPMRSASR
jgi:hypothetical protein